MPATQTNPTAPVRLALVGVSGYGALYADKLMGYHREGRIRLCAATVINPDETVETCRKLEQIGCRIYGDFRQMIEAEAGRVDLCAIPTSIHLHCGMTVAALEAGMHVLVEKPLTASLEEVRTMTDARDRCGKKVYVGFQNMYSKSLWETKARLVGGEFGRVKTIKALALWPRSTRYYTRNAWAGKLYVGNQPVLDSPVNNAMAHFVMMPLFLGGKTLSDTASVVQQDIEAYRAQAIESFDTFSARMETENGIELIFNFSHSTEARHRPTIEVICENGRFQWYENENYRLIGGEEEASQSEKIDPRREMFETIFSRLTGGTGDCCTLELAAAHTRFVTRLHADLAIRDFPAEQIETGTLKGDPYHYVRGLDRQLLQAHETGTVLSETGSDWLMTAAQESCSASSSSTP